MSTGTGATPALNQPIGFRRLKRLVESADEDKNHIFFLDKNGEVERVSQDHQDEIENLLNEAQAHGPYFEILSIVEGRFTAHPTIEILGEPSDSDLQVALSEAWASRQLFYSERVAEFGPDAYPKQSIVPLDE